jgi:hypothetical protein
MLPFVALEMSQVFLRQRGAGDRTFDMAVMDVILLLGILGTAVDSIMERDIVMLCSKVVNTFPSARRAVRRS